ncbi:hypothetical protein A9Q84_14425 [Halobacteriovorax marinus]|uniref:Glutathione S-transferase n=1 Tax=Halobacteriovorax marinus TaxID=97084 RepID=A0A1Y5FAA8_9BACT|nr:hypothetical protein A9Q84_14425 [Halobacteriovorax marinus]
MENQFQIVGHKLCPYVQRVVILAMEKEIPFSRVDIELHDKPPWLLKLSPAGKVPILIVDDEKVLFESNVICEYLDIMSNDSNDSIDSKPSLHPKGTFAKARLLAWGEFGTDILNSIAKIIYQDLTRESFEETIIAIRNRLKIVEQEHSGAKYFAGESFHLIDIIYATLFRYFEVLELVTKENILADLPRLSRWSRELAERRSVQRAVPENYHELLREFIGDKESYLSSAFCRVL